MENRQQVINIERLNNIHIELWQKLALKHGFKFKIEPDTTIPNNILNIQFFKKNNIFAQDVFILYKNHNHTNEWDYWEFICKIICVIYNCNLFTITSSQIHDLITELEAM
jgi:hypothetical protein